VTGYDAIAVELLRFQAKIGGAMDHEAVKLDETAFVEKKLEPFAGRERPLLVLRLEPRLATTQLRLGAPARQQVELVSHRHCSEKLTLDGMGI
jgi:hypothetical protein